jgi:hypothetical protein
MSVPNHKQRTEMLCCSNCFESTSLKDHILHEGRPGRCGFCSSKRATCIQAGELHQLFQPLIGLYRELIPEVDYSEDEDPYELGGSLPDMIRLTGVLSFQSILILI